MTMMMMMMMMKNPIVLVACTLVLSSLAVLASQSSFSPDECCFEFMSRKVPKRNVVSYKYTDNRCPVAGVLLKMKHGITICADPNTKWAQIIIEEKNRSRVENVTIQEPKEKI